MANRITPKVKLSVIIITYNHAKYIAKSIESILRQKTEYPFEIIIMEDCSTDGTQDIVREYQKKYPEIIRAYLNPKNMGTKNVPVQRIYCEGYKKITGDYFAVLEGDDYWSSTDKIQKQVSFLEKNQDFVACSHNTVKIYEDNSKEPHRFLYWENTKQVHDVHDFVAMTSFFHTSSIIYKNVFQGIPPKQLSSRWSCDIFNTMVHMTHGKLYYMDEDMSVYRAHKGGCYSNMTETDGRIFNISGLRRYNRWLGYKYFSGFCFSIHRLCKDLVEQSNAGNIPKLNFYQKTKYTIIGKTYIFLYNIIFSAKNYKTLLRKK